MAAQLAWGNQVNGDNLTTCLSQEVSQSGSPGMICMAMNWIRSPCCLTRQQGHYLWCTCREHLHLYPWPPSLLQAHTADADAAHSALQGPGITHVIVSQKMLCFSAYMSQCSAPANSHSCLFYICLSFLAPRVVASKSQQGTSSWRDQLISLKCSNRQQVGNSFWSKATLRRLWKWRLDEQLQNLKCPAANQDKFKQTQILKNNLLRHWRN